LANSEQKEKRRDIVEIQGALDLKKRKKGETFSWKKQLRGWHEQN